MPSARRNVNPAQAINNLVIRRNHLLYHFSIQLTSTVTSLSKILVTNLNKPRLLIFHSAISLSHKKFLFQRLQSIDVFACDLWFGPSQSKILATRMNTAPLEEMSLQCGAVGNIIRSDLTGSRFKPQTFRSRDECVTARPTCRLTKKVVNFSKHEISDSSQWAQNV